MWFWLAEEDTTYVCKALSTVPGTWRSSIHVAIIIININIIIIILYLHLQISALVPLFEMMTGTRLMGPKYQDQAGAQVHFPFQP